MEAAMQIDLGKKLRPTRPRYKVLGRGSWEPVSNSLQIQRLIVYTQSQTTVLLGCKENRGTILRQARANNACLKENFNLTLQLGHMLWSHFVWTSIRRNRARFEIYHQIQEACRGQTRHSACLENIVLEHLQARHDRLHHRRRGMLQVVANFRLDECELVGHILRGS